MDYVTTEAFEAFMARVDRALADLGSENRDQARTIRTLENDVSSLEREVSSLKTDVSRLERGY